MTTVDTFSQPFQTGAINAVAGFSTRCKHDETVLKPCSLGLVRMEVPSYCGGIGRRALVLGAAVAPPSLEEIPGVALVVTNAGNAPCNSSGSLAYAWSRGQH